MELEHLFQQSGAFTAFQMVFMSAIIIPGAFGRDDLYRVLAKKLASYVVTFGPMAILLYILYQVSLLS